MKYFVVEKTLGCKWKVRFSRLAMRYEQCRPFVREVMADQMILTVPVRGATLNPKSGITGHCFTNTESKNYPKHS